MTAFPIWIARVVTSLAYNDEFAVPGILGSHHGVMSGCKGVGAALRVGRKVNAGFTGRGATNLPRNQMPITGTKPAAIGWVNLRERSTLGNARSSLGVDHRGLAT